MWLKSFVVPLAPIRIVSQVLGHKKAFVNIGCRVSMSASSRPPLYSMQWSLEQ